MSAMELWISLYQGEQNEPPSSVIGSKPSDIGAEMICDCDPDDEC